MQKLCVHVCVYSWDRKQMLKRKREKSQREQTANSSQLGRYKSHAVTRRAGSKTGVQCVARQLVVVFSPHPSHTFFITPVHTCVHTHTYTHTLSSKGPAGQRLMTENRWSEKQSVTQCETKLPGNPATPSSSTGFTNPIQCFYLFIYFY